MAITATSRNAISSNVPTPKVTVTAIAFDSSYPTGGEPVTASDLGLNRVDFAITTLKSAATTTVNIANAYYDRDTAKVLLYDETPAQVANAADVAGAVAEVIAFGR